MSTQHQQRRTRTANSNAHPGLVDRGAVRRSHEEVMEAKKTKEDAKLKKLANEKLAKASKAKKIAQLEQAIDNEDDALDITPRPQNGKKKPLRRTATFLHIPTEGEPEYLDSSMDENITDHGPNVGYDSVNKSLPAVVDQELCSEEDGAPAKKKKKVERTAKPSMRDQIREARDTAHHPQEGSAATKNLSALATEIYEIEDEIPFHPKDMGKPKQKEHPKRQHPSTIDEDNDENAMRMGGKQKGIMAMHGVDGGLKRGRSTEVSGVSKSNAYVENNFSGLTDEINAWAVHVPPGEKARFKTRVQSASTPSLTNAPSSRFSRSSAPRSALNNAIKIRNSDKDEVQILRETGFISDQDETMGDERDAAVKSPPKPGRRISSSGIVKLELISPKPVARTVNSGKGIKTEPGPSSKPVKKSQEKASNSQLPAECHENNTWTKRVLPTLFRWAGHQPAPFTIPEAKILKALKAICSGIYGDSVEIDFGSSSVALRLVNQRLSDRWRTTFGSCAIAILNAFFDSVDKYRDSDERRQQFASHMLKDFRFIYAKANGDDPKTFRGLFRGQFIIQCFAAHFNAIHGSVRITDLCETDENGEPLPEPKPRPTLALAAAAVERALVLTSTGTLTIAAIRESQKTKKSIKLPTMVNPETGKESTRHATFSEITWGKATGKYLKSIIKQLDDSAMESIISQATYFAKSTTDIDGGWESSGSIDDERALLVEGSGAYSDSMTGGMEY